MVFQPPAASLRQLTGVDFSTAVDFAAQAKQRFDAKDNDPKNKDPSVCKALLKFPGDNGPVFWSSKMSIDTDGPAAGPGRLPGSKLDPDPEDGQDGTSYHPYGGGGLSSEIVPYIVLPKLVPDPHSALTFDPAVQLGDVAIVIFKDKITSAVCGDLGPFNKIGEASIRVHEALYDGKQCRDPCTKRSPQGYCLKTRNASVEEDVLFFVFPKSSFDDGVLTFANINTQVSERAFSLYNKLRSAAVVADGGQAPP